MGTYRVAEICRNGYVITGVADMAPDLRERYCSTCGSETITSCQSCGAPIRGYYEVENVVSLVDDYRLPRFCYQCGQPYPWTQERLQAAGQLAEELEGLSEQERDVLKKSLNELVQDTPATEVAALRVKKVLRKAGEAGAEIFKKILVDVLSETAKKALGM